MFQKNILILLAIASINIDLFSQIDIGKRIPTTLQSIDSSEFILKSNDDIERSYSIVFEGMKFQVTLNLNNEIDYIETADPKFQTPEKVKVGMKFKYLEEYCKPIDLIDRKGWAKYIRLNSGWYVAFSYDEAVTNESTVLFLFKK